MAPSKIADALAMQRSALSITLRRLKQHKYVCAVKNRIDARGELIEITSQGREAITKHEQPRLIEVQKALSGLTAQEHEEFGQLLARFSGEPSGHGKQFTGRYTIRRLESVVERQAACVFYLKQIARLDAFETVPETLFDAASRCFGLYEKNTLVAVCQFQAQGTPTFASVLPDSEWQTENAFIEQTRAS